MKIDNRASTIDQSDWRKICSSALLGQIRHWSIVAARNFPELIKYRRATTPESPKVCLEVVVPYIANTYDEYRFRKVHARSQLFEVTMGGEYIVETRRNGSGMLADDKLGDDIKVNDDTSDAMVPLPARIADALRMRLEAKPDS